MDEAQNAVKPADAGNQAAAPGGVETPTNNAPVGPTLAEHEALVAELAKAKEDRDNYRKGLLKAKGKAVKEDHDVEEPDLDTLVKQKVAEALEQEKEVLAEKKYDAAIDALLQKNKVLALALQNKANMPNASAGSGHGSKDEPIDTFFTADQLADLKKKGLDPEKVKANLLKKR